MHVSALVHLQHAYSSLHHVLQTTQAKDHVCINVARVYMYMLTNRYVCKCTICLCPYISGKIQHKHNHLITCTYTHTGSAWRSHTVNCMFYTMYPHTHTLTSSAGHNLTLHCVQSGGDDIEVGQSDLHHWPLPWSLEAWQQQLQNNVPLLL